MLGNLTMLDLLVHNATLPDGRTGLGMTEYIEVLENGEPVGYPL